MIRELTRKKQQLSRAECLELLQSQLRGVLSVQGDGGYPYGMPINYYYNPEDGKLYFHSGKTGHRSDALRGCDKASFCVLDQGVREPGDWFLTFRSVIIFGRIEMVEERERIYELAARLSRRFTGDEAYIQQEIRQSGPATLMFALVPEQITGKRVREK